MPPTDASAPRLIAAVLGTTLLGAAGWLSLHNLRRDQFQSWIFWVPVALPLLTMGLLCWWTVLAGQEPRARPRIAASWRMGWILGGIGPRPRLRWPSRNHAEREPRSAARHPHYWPGRFCPGSAGSSPGWSDPSFRVITSGNQRVPVGN